jgi:hypothetical protein
LNSSNKPTNPKAIVNAGLILNEEYYHLIVLYIGYKTNKPKTKKMIKIIDKQEDISYTNGLALAIVNARELLEKEKEVIVEACDHNKGVNGWSDGLENQ